MYIEVIFQSPLLLHLPALYPSPLLFCVAWFWWGPVFGRPECIFSCTLDHHPGPSAQQGRGPEGALNQHLSALGLWWLFECQHFKILRFLLSILTGIEPLWSLDTKFVICTRWQHHLTECPFPALSIPSKSYFLSSGLFHSWKIQVHSLSSHPPTCVDLSERIITALFCSFSQEAVQIDQLIHSDRNQNSCCLGIERMWGSWEEITKTQENFWV